MSKFISDNQKKELFLAIPSQVLIDGTKYTASKLWYNQKLTTYPAVTLKISSDGIPAYVDVVEGIQYYQALMTVHVLADNVSGKKSGTVLAEALAGQISAAAEHWIDPLSENIRIFDIENDISSIRNMGNFEGTTATDLVFSIKLYHD